jgi:hypothetical protein
MKNMEIVVKTIKIKIYIKMVIRKSKLAITSS